jgi:hypothetical protein
VRRLVTSNLTTPAASTLPQADVESNANAKSPEILHCVKKGNPHKSLWKGILRKFYVSTNRLPE